MGKNPGKINKGKNSPADPCVMVIFGAFGDLTKRKLVPTLYNLTRDGFLSKNFAVVGVVTFGWGRIGTIGWVLGSAENPRLCQLASEPP